MLRSESNFMGQWTKSTHVSVQGWEQFHGAGNKVGTSLEMWCVKRHPQKRWRQKRCLSPCAPRGVKRHPQKRWRQKFVSSVTHKRGDGEMCVKRHPEERWRQINFNVAEENRRLLLRNICDNASESRFFFQFCFCAMEISVVEWPIVDLLVHLVLLISRTPRKWAALQVGKDWEEQYFEGCCCSFGAWKMFATERHCLCKSIGGEGVLKQKGWEG